MKGIKYTYELKYWSDRLKSEGVLANFHHRGLMLSISGKSPVFSRQSHRWTFWERLPGSMEWMDNVKERYCIDVLAE